jgi:plasmid maintenance system killer protein
MTGRIGHPENPNQWLGTEVVRSYHPTARFHQLKPAGSIGHPLKGDRAGQHSISINDQWRICFVWKDGDTYDVEIVDYH